MILYQAIIPLNPRTKKNGQKIIINKKTKAPMVIQNPRYIQYENEAGWFLRKPAVPISEPVNVKCIFYRDTKRLCDLPNLLNAILDILRLYGIIEDDNRNIVYSVDGSKVLYDKENPRTEITITKAEDVQVWGKKSK